MGIIGERSVEELAILYFVGFKKGARGPGRTVLAVSPAVWQGCLLLGGRATKRVIQV